MLVPASFAHAATGTLSGNWQFWNRNGNFCPTNNACQGSRYTQAMFDRRQPISNATVWITDAAFNKIGQGVTNNSGDFNAQWTATAAPAQIRVLILPTHATNRFSFRNTAGQLVNNTTAVINLTGANPQNIGQWTVGTSASPDPFYNAYWAAELQWRNVLSFVGFQAANFVNIEVRGFADNIPGYLGNRPTSAADGPTKRVQLDANAGFAPQWRAMHELGHIANYVDANPFKASGAGDWMAGAVPPATQTGGWNAASGEWGSLAFEEAFATHYGDMTFWFANADTPTNCLAGNGITCYSGGAPSAGTNIEASSFPFTVNNCSTAVAAPEGRWTLSAMRYLWDVYDDHNDADGDTYSAAQTHFAEHLAVIASYPAGTGANAINEPWNSALNSITEPDGRGCLSYASNFQSFSGVSTSLLRVDNCSPL